MMCSTVEPVASRRTGETASAVRALRGATVALEGRGNLGAGLGGIALEAGDDMAAATGSAAAAAGTARSLAIAGADFIAASDAAIAFCSGVRWSELTFSPWVLACCCCMLTAAGCAAAAGASAAARAATLLVVVGAWIAASDAAIAFCSGVRWSELTFLPRASVSSKRSAMLPGASFGPSVTGVAAHSKLSSIPNSTLASC